MLEKLGDVLKKATNKIANAIFLDKNLVDSIIKDLQRALIEADVNIHLVKELSDKIKKAALDERIKEIEKKEHIIKLLHDELINILGEYKELKLKQEQNRILLLGLYGAGKTTTVSKLGNYFAKRGKKTAVIGLDVHRPAAPEQLKQLAEKNKLKYFVDLEEKDPIKIWKKFKDELEDYDVVIVDTAGRDALDKELVTEISALNRQINPTESILVMPADIGQAAKNQAETFKEMLQITGVIITRMDSTAKGGGALTACAETQAPVYFITTGEKINDIEQFNPQTFLSRLLGMGDLQSLIEKVKSVTNENEQKAIQERMEQGKLTLHDVIEQVKTMGSMGGFDKIKGMIPGLGSAKIPEGALESQEEKLKKWEHIIKSMTPKEINNPDIIETSRINRIAKGAGVNNRDVRSLLKQYNMLQEMVKTGNTMDMDMEKGFDQKKMMKFAKKFMKGKKMRF